MSHSLTRSHEADEISEERHRHVVLNEWKTSDPIFLPLEQRDELQLSAASIGISPAAGQDGWYELRPGSKIGVINIEGLSVEIRPKLPIDRVLFLISYALDPDAWKKTDFGFGHEASLFEAMIPGFVLHMRRAIRRGLLQGYRTVEEALPSVRGRLRFDDQIRYRFGIALPAEVRFDEFTEDIEINRLLKAAMHRLGRMRIRSSRAQRSLRALAGFFGSVTATSYSAGDLPEIHFTRLNEHYRPAVELAKLILRSSSIELRWGETISSRFLVDMNVVFENFVVVALREALGTSESAFPQNAAGRSLCLDDARRVRLKPDLSWWQGNDCCFVGDVKYKQTSVEGVTHPDLYQLLAYAIATDLPGGLLVYAAGESEPAVHEVVYLGRNLEVVSLDLAGSPEQVLEQIDGVAIRIRSHRAARFHSLSGAA